MKLYTYIYIYIIDMWDKGAEINIPDNDKITALHCAAQNEHVFVAEILLQNNAEINGKDNFGYTPLHFAMCSNTEEIVKVLLEYGADIDTRNINGTTPLMLSIESDFKWTKLLLQNGTMLQNFCVID